MTPSAVRGLRNAIRVIDGTGHSHVPVHSDALRRLLDMAEGAPVNTKWLHYVRHADVPLYLAAGWALEHDLKGTHHSEYSVLLVWEGEGEPPKPDRAKLHVVEMAK